MTIETYKTTPQGDLSLHCFFSPASAPRPAIVFFFVGGWQTGSPAQFYPQAEHFASLGFFAAAAEYRVHSRHGTFPSHAVRDAVSAVRWLRQNARRFNIDPCKIYSGGGSAGGHIAAAAALCRGFDEPGEDASVSSRPDALVLFNPAVDNGPTGYSTLIDVPWETISPLHNITPDAPPSVFFLGDRDTIVPVSCAHAWRDRLSQCGVRCDLHLYEGYGHGFFNPREDDMFPYRDTLAKAVAFVSAL